MLATASCVARLGSCNATLLLAGLGCGAVCILETDARRERSAGFVLTVGTGALAAIGIRLAGLGASPFVVLGVARVGGAISVGLAGFPVGFGLEHTASFFALFGFFAGLAFDPVEAARVLALAGFNLVGLATGFVFGGAGVAAFELARTFLTDLFLRTGLFGLPLQASFGLCGAFFHDVLAALRFAFLGAIAFALGKDKRLHLFVVGLDQLFDVAHAGVLLGAGFVAVYKQADVLLSNLQGGLGGEGELARVGLACSKLLKGGEGELHIFVAGGADVVVGRPPHGNPEGRGDVVVPVVLDGERDRDRVAFQSLVGAKLHVCNLQVGGAEEAEVLCAVAGVGFGAVAV